MCSGTETFARPIPYYGRKISLLMGSVVLTKNRFACYRGSILPLVFEVPVEHEAFNAFDFSIDEKARLKVVIDAPAFQEGWKGTIDCRIPSEKALEFLRALTIAKP